MKHIFILSIMVTFVFSSCKKEKTVNINSGATGELTVEFDNIAGGADLQLNTGTYTNASAEDFKVSTLKYFVSNFILTSSDGTVYKIPQDSCYFLIDESNTASTNPKLKLPEGDYKTLSFMLGVDSLRNTKDISQRTGVLDPAGLAAGMYWTWNSGYIHFKIEGTSPVSTQIGNLFQYHIGLFGGYTAPTINNTRMITLDLSARGIARVRSGKATDVHLTVDILKLFTGASNVSISSVSAIHGATGSAAIANNYTAMFQHDHTHN